MPSWAHPKSKMFVSHSWKLQLSCWKRSALCNQSPKNRRCSQGPFVPGHEPSEARNNKKFCYTDIHEPNVEFFFPSPEITAMQHSTWRNRATIWRIDRPMSCTSVAGGWPFCIILLEMSGVVYKPKGAGGKSQYPRGRAALIDVLHLLARLFKLFSANF